MRRVVVAGVGMIPFTKPGQSEPYPVMGESAARIAVKDSGLDFERIEQAYVGYVFGDSTSGQAALYRVGLSGIPIFNVNNNCATGSTALYLARQAIANGSAEAVLALGFEQMNPGALARCTHNDRVNTMQRFLDTSAALQDNDETAPLAAQWFGGAGREYQQRYGMANRSFAQVSVKARAHAANNPFALFRTPLSVDEVMASKHIYGPLTRYQCCPPTCGAAAAVLCSESFVQRHGIHDGISILVQAMTTDRESTFRTSSMMRLVGYDMAKAAAEQAYAQAGLGPTDVDVVELHDCFTANEVITYEALGLTPEGTAEKFIAEGDNTYGGRVVVNPSGGLLSKGHPLGATGLAQCTELVLQLRGRAERRQVDEARIALQHNLGLGGACVVTLYARD